MIKKHRAGRYPNVKKTIINGIVFASGTEAKRYCELLLLVKVKAITALVLQPHIQIKIQDTYIMMRSPRYPNGRKLTYVADFSYVDKDTGKMIIEDVKMQSGHRTDVYKIKRALVEAMGIHITEV